MRIIWVVLCVASLILPACSKKEASREEVSGRYSDTTVVATSGSSRPVVVREAGIRFDTPSTWSLARYRADSKSGDDAANEQAGASHWVDIAYQPEESDHKQASLLRLLVFARHVWSRIETEAGPPVGTVVESLDAWVYVAQLPQSNPYSRTSRDGEQFEAMRLSIREVRARFSIEGDGPLAAPTGNDEL